VGSSQAGCRQSVYRVSRRLSVYQCRRQVAAVRGSDVEACPSHRHHQRSTRRYSDRLMCCNDDSDAVSRGRRRPASACRGAG